ncbi:MAG: type II secretion system F family protein [Alphaproteobacteria bacterium]
MSSAPTRRLNRVAGKVSEERKVKPEQLSLKRSTSDSAIPFINRLIKVLLRNPEKLRARLERTGRHIALGEYLLLVAVLTLILYMVFANLMLWAQWKALLCGVLAGWFIPHMIVGRMGKKRIAKFLKYFPESIDTMCRGLRSGLPISESMNAVAREMPDPVGIEFMRITDAVRLGKTMDQAMWDVARRIDTQEFRFMIIAMSIQRETGGNLAETLGNLSELLRKRRQLRLKIRALSSEARASALIIGSLPFVMFLILLAINRDYMLGMVYAPQGQKMLYIAGGLMALGHGIMAKMIRFEV